MIRRIRCVAAVFSRFIRLPGLAAGGFTKVMTPSICRETSNCSRYVTDVHVTTQELLMIGSTAHALVVIFHHLTSEPSESSARISSASMGNMSIGV